ncbi:serine/threonine-protein kinase [Actinoplanes sp. G11-F43]|uniref:serine/threonine-protein kinase n=1 Tax=Actinoplanes sp. G11-F43 TaxID=3424130 RepID=UPI003D3272D0
MAEIEFIGRYRVSRKLGGGAFAEVFLAVDEDLESPVAIKVLADRWALDADIRERFLNEARLLRRIGGPRLVAVHDIGQLPDGRPYFVMAYADRGTVEDRLAAAGGRVPVDAALAVVREVALALQTVHQAGVVHRDVKPANLLIFKEDDGGRATGDGSPLLKAGERLVLGDFGLAKDLTVRASGLSLPVGTPGYMAPEQSDPSAAVDQRADVYACSALLARLLTGRPGGVDGTDRSISPAVRNTITSGLSPSPDARPSSAAQWLADLDGAPGGHRLMRTGMVASALVVALTVVAVTLLGYGWPKAGGVSGAAPAVSPTVRWEQVKDDTGAIAVRVPSTWSQRWGNGWHPGQSPFFNRVNVGPGLNASPNVSDWFTDAAVPGLFVGVSSKVVAEGGFTPEYMARYFGPSGCTVAETGGFRLDRLALTGVQGLWTCPGGVRWRYAYGWPEGRDRVLAVEIKMVAPGDEPAWTEALNSVTVSGTPK